jgi:chromate transporter
LSVLFLASHPPLWVAGAAAGAGAAVPAVAAQAALGLAPASWRRATAAPAGANPATASQAARPAGWRGAGLDRARLRWVAYLVVGAVVAALAGPYLVFALAACGLTELMVRTGGPARGSGRVRAIPALPLALAAPLAAIAAGTLLSVAWVAFKVGALSYGGGFVIIPLMQHDVVHTYHWMSGGQFLSAVALGQVTPGPVVQTVAVVGYAAAGVPGGLLASFVAFTPSFLFVLVGAPRFAALRRSQRVQAFLTGAGPTAIGAIAGSTIPLALALSHLWQAAVLGLALIALIAARRNVVIAIVGAAALGIAAALAGAPIGQAA